MATDRSLLFNAWLFKQLSQLKQTHISKENVEIASLTGDAGFRQYFRIVLAPDDSFIAVDAPPELSNNCAFVNVANALEKNQVSVPSVLAFDETNGFMVLEDLGDRQFFDVIAQEELLPWYKKAIDELVKISTLDYQGAVLELPDYNDAFVLTELSIFTQWLVGEYLAIELTSEQQQHIERTFNVLIQNVADQPRVMMHRDFHSRNLMVQHDQIAVIDFQDAVHGAITYDIVSLLRDCYKQLSNEEISVLFDYFLTKIKRTEQLAVLTEDVDKSRWQRWFDLMGMQRHIKASGIFARLSLRDNKHGYLNDIPLTLRYIIEVSSHYPELVWFGSFVEKDILPQVLRKLS